MVSPSQESLLEATAQHFEAFVGQQFRGTSPLYEHLARGIAKDREILAIAALGRNNPKALLFLGAVHFLLLMDAQHPLRNFYASLTTSPRPPEEAYPYFRDFCLEHSAEITRLTASWLVQTNEVQRCSSLLPAFVGASRSMPGKALSIIDIGASAGLNLLWDYYGYSYGESLRTGDLNSPVQLTCELRGGRQPPIPPELPHVAYRVGIDLNVIDVRNPEEALWLRALVWPEQRERAELLVRAVEIARQNPPALIVGDVLNTLEDTVARVPNDTMLCIYHSYTMNQLSPQDRERFSQLVERLASTRQLARVSLEWIGTEHPQLELIQYEAGSKFHRLLAYCHMHGRWIEWLNDDRNPDAG